MTKTSFTIKWESPENDGGTPITDYIIEVKETSKKTWQKVDSSPIYLRMSKTAFANIYTCFFQITSTKGDITNAIISNLKADVSYNFRITAKNSVGTGPPYIAEETITAGKRPSESLTISYFLKCLYSWLSLKF